VRLGSIILNLEESGNEEGIWVEKGDLMGKRLV